MMSEKEKKILWEELSPDDKLKYEIAQELGLLEKVKETGWKSLSAKETGRIGGLMTKRRGKKSRKRIAKIPEMRHTGIIQEQAGSGAL